MENSTVTFCEELARRFPSLRDLLKKHRSDYEEILPHVFIADIARYVLSEPPDRLDVVAFVDRGFRNGGNDVQELLAVSFVENLASSEEIGRALKNAEADALREEWERQHST